MRRIQLVVISFAMALSVNAQTLPYLDESRSIEERVEDLLSRLTVDEKIDLMRATSPANERLGFPKYYHGNEALHGVVRPGKFTVFPQAIGLASTWNPTLLNTISTAISDEARARWNELERGKKQTNQFSDLLTFWSPTVNMARDPRWGRTPETYGEDPFLTGEMGAAFVKGLQGDHPRYLKVVSTPKHFTANNEEHNRFECDAKISERWLREYYLPAFEACIRRGHTESIMSAYNAINGIPCTANPWLLNKVLRDEWGFKGYVVSDCGAVGNVWEDHHFTKRTETAAALCLKAGLDLECGDNFYIEPLHEAYKMGMVDDSDIDRAARRILTARMKLGFFDTSGNNPYDKISPSVIGSEKHRQLALEAAREAIVLLKNANRTLPLNKSKLKSIAVVGLNAATCEFGDYSGQPMTEPVSILQGIKDYVGDKVNVRYAPWESAGDSIGGNITAEAKEAARNSDVVIAVMGINRSIEREGKDRSDINLPADQKEFIKAMYKINKNVVLVIVAGSSLDLRWENENIPAIVNAWYPGQEGGTAVAEVLFGKYNPAGRLPLTYYNSIDDLPAFDDYDLSNRTYKYFKGGVLYPFGYGLSYSQFKYSNLIINEKENTIDVEFEVKNIGRYDGDEVAQVYVQLSEYEGVVPEKELRGFKRVHLKKGEKQRVTVSLRREDLRYWSESKSKFIYPAGVPKIMVGTSSADIRLIK
ncbi:MAG: glycoside hydrolase family 3 C-terminal domain-containing protein [Prevotella sp.]|nr:glycoside hydrolase family 3 C-terminal domain-containing protein [Prevotella sp.]